MAQILGELAFNQPVTTTQPKTLLLNMEASKVSDVQFQLNIWAAATDGIRNKHSITIANPVTASVPDGSFYLVTTDDGTTEKTATFRFDTGMTATQVATGLAEVVDLHPTAAAEAAAGVITETAQLGGTALTITVDCVDASGVQVSGAISTAEVTAASGEVSPFHKYTELLISVAATADLKPEVRVSGKWWNGAIATPVQSQTYGIWTSSSPATIAAMNAMT